MRILKISLMVLAMVVSLSLRSINMDGDVIFIVYRDQRLTL